MQKYSIFVLIFISIYFFKITRKIGYQCRSLNFLAHYLLKFSRILAEMMALDIISPSSFMDPVEAEPERKQHEHLTYFIKNPATINVLQKKGIKFFFPIQYMTFQTTYNRQDLIGRDRTGSGKTMAYSLPVLQRFRKQQLFSNPYIKFLIILPTRQLCIQVANQIQSLKLSPNEYNVLPLYGGVQIFKHISALKQKVDIIVATPGRLIDLLQKGKVNLEGLQCLCLDQADQMLKMGFQQDVQKVYNHVNRVAYQKPQSLLFSATVPLWVQRIAAKFMTKNRALIDLIKGAQIKTSKTVTHCSMCMKYKDIVPLMKDIVNVYCGKQGRCIIFCERKDQVKQIMYKAELNIEAEALHSDVAQSQRQITFKKFKQGKLKCLISTNVAARGLDIPNVDLVIQLQPPKKVDDYIHRSGRTGRAGHKGVCLTIYLKSEQYLLRNIQKVANIRFKDIGPPQPDDILNRVTLDLVQHLKQQDDSVLDYFQWSASQMIYELGAQKALAKALAYITGIKNRIQTESIMDKEKNMITYKFKYIGSDPKKLEVSNETLIKFLEERLFSEIVKPIDPLFPKPKQTQEKQKQTMKRLFQHVKKTIKSVTPRCLAFNMPQIYLKKMQSLQHQHKSDYQIIRVSAMFQLTNQQIQQDQLPRYTQQQYDQAEYNNHQLYIGRLPSDTDAYQLQKLFHSKGVRFIALDMKNKDDGGKVFAFMKCLTEKDLQKAVQMDGYLTFGGKKLELRAAENKNKDKNEKKDRKGDREHKHDRHDKKHHHHKQNYENGNSKNYQNRTQAPQTAQQW